MYCLLNDWQYTMGVKGIATGNIPKVLITAAEAVVISTEDKDPYVF